MNTKTNITLFTLEERSNSLIHVLCVEIQLHIFERHLKYIRNSKCEILSCVGVKDAFHSIRLSAQSKNIVEFFSILEAHTINIKFFL